MHNPRELTYVELGSDDDQINQNVLFLIAGGCTGKRKNVQSHNLLDVEKVEISIGEDRQVPIVLPRTIPDGGCQRHEDCLARHTHCRMYDMVALNSGLSTAKNARVSCKREQKKKDRTL